MTLAGGIDLGGTKIDARLFDPGAGWAQVAGREVTTPRDDYAALLAALVEAADWLRAQGAETLGLGAPGLVTPDGLSLTANLPANGRPLGADLAAALGRPLPVINDCRAFALSEARLGAGRGAASVLGLVIGTGLAAGFVAGGRALSGANGQAGEVGHTPLPHGVAAAHDLPWLDCGCGRRGCYETICAGPGLARLAARVTGRATPPEALLRDAPEAAEAVLAIWAEVMANLLAALVLTYDPEVIVLGGGVSRLPGVVGRLHAALLPELLAGTTPPRIVLADGGDRSGARGAALFGAEAAATGGRA